MVLRIRQVSSVKPLCPTLHCIRLQGKELLSGDFLLAVAQDWVVLLFSPFGLAAWFMGDSFPLHQLLHCIGVDDWSDWVAFVSPRVFLFHCLFPPETSGK